MTHRWVINMLALILLLYACHGNKGISGKLIEEKVLNENNLGKDSSSLDILQPLLDNINCSIAQSLNKKMVLAGAYNSGETSLILVIPFVSNGVSFTSSAYSYIYSNIILVNPSFIREFTA
jgi:hypothetical protein